MSRRRGWICSLGLILAIEGCGQAPLGNASPAPRSTTTPSAAPTASSAPTSQDVVPITDQPLFEVVDPGTYSIDHDGLADTPLRVVFTIEADGWRGWAGTYKDEEGEDAEGRLVGLTIAAASEVVADPCHEHIWENPGPTVDDLATALASLPGFELTAPVSDVSAYGYEGKHLELQVPDLEHDAGGFVECLGGYFYGWRAFTAHQRTLHKYYQGPDQMLEFWILDIEGSRLLIEAVRFPNSPADDVAELRVILDSIRIEP